MKPQLMRLLIVGLTVLFVSACGSGNAAVSLPTATQTPMPSRTPRPSPTVEPTLVPGKRESSKGIYLVDLSTDYLQLITEPGIDYDYPQFSPDGRYIAFARTEEGGRGLVLYDRQTRKMSTVAEGSRRICELFWSPDSKWVAFIVGTDICNNVALRIYELSTKTATTVAEDGGEISAFSWSPDGKRLTFALDWTPEGASKLRVYEPRTKRATIIAEDEGDVGSGSWSPDGKRLAFVLNRASEGSAELRVHEPDASLTTALLAWEGWICSLLWSPDGERLAFSGAVEKPGQHSFSCKSEVYTINAGGGGITKLTSHGGNISGLSWSPTDENTLAYVLYSDMDQFGGINGDLYLIDPTVPDSQPAALLKNIFYLGCPDWSPDGQYLAIGTYESGLLIDMRTLVQRPISGGAMKWSPDSTALLFETIGGGVSMVAMRRIRWIDIESPYSEHHAAEDFLHGKRFWQTNADWAPDMEEIAFAGLLNAPDPAP